MTHVTNHSEVAYESPNISISDLETKANAKVQKKSCFTCSSFICETAKTIARAIGAFFSNIISELSLFFSRVFQAQIGNAEAHLPQNMNLFELQTDKVVFGTQNNEDHLLGYEIAQDILENEQSYQLFITENTKLIPTEIAQLQKTNLLFKNILIDNLNKSEILFSKQDTANLSSKIFLQSILESHFRSKLEQSLAQNQLNISAKQADTLTKQFIKQIQDSSANDLLINKFEELADKDINLYTELLKTEKATTEEIFSKQNFNVQQKEQILTLLQSNPEYQDIYTNSYLEKDSISELKNYVQAYFAKLLSEEIAFFTMNMGKLDLANKIQEDNFLIQQIIEQNFEELKSELKYGSSQEAIQNFHPRLEELKQALIDKLLPDEYVKEDFSQEDFRALIAQSFTSLTFTNYAKFRIEQYALDNINYPDGQKIILDNFNAAVPFILSKYPNNTLGLMHEINFCLKSQIELETARQKTLTEEFNFHIKNLKKSVNFDETIEAEIKKAVIEKDQQLMLKLLTTHKAENPDYPYYPKPNLYAIKAVNNLNLFFLQLNAKIRYLPNLYTNLDEKIKKVFFNMLDQSLENYSYKEFTFPIAVSEFKKLLRAENGKLLGLITSMCTNYLWNVGLIARILILDDDLLYDAISRELENDSVELTRQSLEDIVYKHYGQAVAKKIVENELAKENKPNLLPGAKEQIIKEVEELLNSNRTDTFDYSKNFEFIMSSISQIKIKYFADKAYENKLLANFKNTLSPDEKSLLTDKISQELTSSFSPIIEKNAKQIEKTQEEDYQTLFNQYATDFIVKLKKE